MADPAQPSVLVPVLTSLVGLAVNPQPSRQQAKTYYRALVYPETRARWRARQYNSTHSYIPDEWRELWKNSEGKAAEEHYPLPCKFATFTEGARKKFLELAGTLGLGEKWPDAELTLAGELAGVCAFISPAEAYKYGYDSGDPDQVHIVEFSGEEVCPDPYHKNGVVVRVIKHLGAFSVEDFRKRHNLEPPKQPEIVVS